MSKRPFGLLQSNCWLSRRVGSLVLLTFLLGSGVALVQAQSPESSTDVAVLTKPPEVRSGIEEYRLGPGDQIAIQLFGKPQLSREERVDLRGMIRMPLIEEEIRASCRTETELAQEISRLYRERNLLKNPLVSVSIKEFQSQPVAVMGSVNSPGRFILRRRVRLLELLVFHAGGPQPKAGRKVQILSTAAGSQCDGSNPVPVTNTGDDKASELVATYDLRELMEGKATMNPYVQPGDIINIPSAEEAIVVGNVARPSTVSLVEPTTISRAIAMVGGTLPNTKKDRIVVRRQIPGSIGTTEHLVDLKAVDKSKGADFLLQGGDIVEVSTKTGLSAILANLYKNVVPGLQNLPMTVIW